MGSRIIYETLSICPKCAFLEKKGYEWKPAYVLERDKKIWISLACMQHGPHDTLYCSNAPFFYQMMKYSPEALEPAAPPTTDIEELCKQMEYKSPGVVNHPLVMEVSLFESGMCLPDAEIARRIEIVKESYPPNRHFLLRLNGKLATDMSELNKKVKFAQQAVGPAYHVLLETTFERHIMLSRLPDSAFVNPRIHPSIKMYVRSGEERQAEKEISDSLAALSDFAGLQAAVTLVVTRPLPDLAPLLAMLRERPKLVRLITISLERSPPQVVDTFKPKEVPPPAAPASGESGTRRPLPPPPPVGTVDPVELLECISAASAGTISVEDFFPVSAGVVLEPLISMTGYGNFTIRPSPFCGFMTFLVNYGSEVSKPATRLIDMHKLYSGMLPIISKMKSTSDKIGFFMGRNIKDAVKKSVKPGPLQSVDLVNYLIDPSLAVPCREVLSSLQVMVVHNTMDVASLDSTRRARCTLCEFSTATPNGFAATCTHCV